MLDRQAMRVRCKGLAGMRLMGTAEAEARMVLGDDFPAALDLLDECEEAIQWLVEECEIHSGKTYPRSAELLAKLKGRK